MAGPSWLIGAVRDYRAAGFFAEHRASSDEELAGELAGEHGDEWGEELPPPDAPPVLREILILEKDRLRTWWLDPEADAVAGNDSYVTLLDRLGELSGGSFRPEGAEESWGGDPLRPTVTFSFEGRERELRPEVRGDWIDLRVLAAINQLLADDQRRFYTLTPDDQTALVLALTTEERSLIEATRGVCPEVPEPEE